MASGTVANVLKRVTEAGLGHWPLPKDLDETALRARLYPSGGANKAFQQQRPDWDEVIKGLKEPRGRRRARMTQRQLWVEYRDEVEAQGGVAYSYSRFCAKLKDLLLAEPAAAEMRFDYAPGQYAMSDFSDKTLSLRDKSGGVVDVEIFVAVLPYSNLIYAEAVLDQKINSWAMAHRRALEYFKGVPKCLIIDNLKSGVTRPDREEPHLNATFREFALHYGLATLPARPCRPTDKGAAESAVRTVQSPPMVQNATARTTPALLGLYSLVCLRAQQASESNRMSYAAAWYEKTNFTFSDAIAVIIRCEIFWLSSRIVCLSFVSLMKSL